MSKCRFRCEVLGSCMSLVVLSFLSINGLIAQDSVVRVRENVDPESTVYLGQRIRFRVDVLAPDVWANLPTQPVLDVPGSIALSPPNTSLRLSETIGGTSFIGQRYEWWVYPQRVGELTIPAQNLNVQLKPLGFGRESTFESASTEPVSVKVILPEGAPKEILVCTDSFSAEQRWKPTGLKFQVGDGISRSIDRSVTDSPAMILEPIRFAEVEGLKAYVKQPAVDDRFDRGSLTGTRTDAVTYVFEQAGEIELPAISVVWWDTSSNSLQRELLEGLTLQIVPADEEQIAQSADSQPTQSTTDWKLEWSLLLGAILILALGVFFSPQLAAKWHAMKKAIKESEPSHFRALIQAARSRDPSRTLRTTMRWLDVAEADLTAPRLDRFLDRYGDETASQQLSSLEAAVDAGADSWDPAQFMVVMRNARNHWLLSKYKVHRNADNPLPPLRGLQNPGSQHQSQT